MLKFAGYDWNLWLWWILANSAGSTLGLTISALLLVLLNATLPGATGDAVASVGTQLTAAPILGLAGLILGLMQRLVLRTVGDSYLAWILATGTGCLLGYMVAVLLLAYSPAQSSTFMTGLILWLAIGFFSGLGQWVLLRSRFASTDWWLLATTVATIIGSAGWLVGGICGGGLTWASAGALTGYVLVRITRPAMD